MREPVQGNEDKLSEILNNSYYQAVQNQLREKTKKLDTKDAPSLQQHQSEKIVPMATKSNASGTLSMYQGDRASVRSMEWTRNQSGDFELNPHAEFPLLSAVDLSGTRVATSTPAYKIELSPRIDRFKESLSQAVVQSRSSNYFVSRFGELKAGMLIQLLSLLGVSPDELKSVQQTAIKEAVKQNIHLMSEAIYSSEMTELLQGGSRQARRAMRLFKATKTQLIKQMALLGDPEYWGNRRLTQEHITQLSRILDELHQEKEGLAYRLDYQKTQYGTSQMVDPDTQKKISRLGQYIQKATQQAHRRRIELRRFEGDKSKELVTLGQQLLDPNANKGSHQ